MSTLKKVIAIFLIIALVFGSLFSLLYGVFADSSANVHLISPTDFVIDSRGNFIVSDVINDGATTALHRINNVENSRITQQFDKVFDKIIIVDDVIYALSNGKIYLLTLNYEKNNYEISSTYDAVGARDLAVYLGDVYYITDSYVKVISVKDGSTRNHENITDGKALLFIKNVLYILFGNNFYTITYDDQGHFLEKSEFRSAPTDQTNLLEIDGKIAFFNQNGVKNASNETILTLSGISRVLEKDGKLYVLTANKINCYAVVNGAYTAQNDFEIGSNFVAQTLPTEITEVIVASSTGYPTNVLYEALGSSNSCEYKLLEKSEKFYILLYDGWENSKYYLVLIEGKYGWIEKGASAITEDKLSVSKNAMSANGQATATIYVYSLPCYDAAGTYKTDTLEKGVKLTIFEQISGVTATNGDWYYVSYLDEKDEIKSGYVNSALVGEVVNKVDDAVVGIFRANPSLKGELKLFRNLILTLPLLDDSGKSVTLSSGMNILVLSQDEALGVSYVQVTIDDIMYKGYLKTADIIKKGLTVYTALGIALLVVVVCCAVFFIIIRKRKKRLIQSQPPEIDELS